MATPMPAVPWTIQLCCLFTTSLINTMDCPIQRERERGEEAVRLSQHWIHHIFRAFVFLRPPFKTNWKTLGGIQYWHLHPFQITGGRVKQIPGRSRWPAGLYRWKRVVRFPPPQKTPSTPGRREGRQIVTVLHSSHSCTVDQAAL